MEVFVIRNLYLFMSLCLVLEISSYTNTQSSLTEIPSDIDNTSTEVIITGTSVHTVKNHTFVGFSSLEKIYLENNNISLVEFEAFTGMPALKTLKLNGNKQIREFPNLLPVCGTLEDLNLSDNNITYVPYDAFAGCTSLRTVNLKLNRLSQVPNVSPIGLALKTLILSENTYISSIPLEHISTTTNIENFFVKDNMLKSLSNISGLVNLVTLSVSYNDLGPLDTSFLNNFSVISELILPGNSFTVFPDCSAISGTLLGLFLRWNRITTISQGAVGSLVKLEELDISNNNLIGFPFQDLIPLPNFHTLDLSNNDITNITDSPGLNLVTEIDLVGNPLSLTCGTNLCWALPENTAGKLLNVGTSCSSPASLTTTPWTDITRQILNCPSSNTTQVSGTGYVRTANHGFGMVFKTGRINGNLYEVISLEHTCGLSSRIKCASHCHKVNCISFQTNDQNKCLLYK